MKTKLLFLLFVINTITTAQNNSISFDWSFNAGGGFNSTKRVQYNSQGDLFAMINSGHQTTYGGTTMTAPSSGSTPATITFIAKRTQSGMSSVFVQKNIVNPTYATFDDFTIDNDDNIIIAGSTFGYSSTVFYNFGNGITLYGKGNFVAKYNSIGVCQWATLITYNLTGSLPYSENKPISIGVLPNNDIYYANRSTNENKPFWLLKLSSSGTEIWHKEWILPTSNTVGIFSSKNHFFFDNTGKAYFVIQSLNGDPVTIDGIDLIPPAGSHPTVSSILTINNDGTNGVFSTNRGAIADIVVEKISGNVILDWRQYVQNPAPFNTLPMAVNGTYQYIGIVALDSNRNHINNSTALFASQFQSIYPLGNLKIVANSLMYPSETLTIPGQTYTSSNYSTAWKFFDNFSMTKFVAHPQIIGSAAASANTMSLYSNKLAVSGSYDLANNASIVINGTTLTTCDKDPNFATLYPNWASLQGDVFISQLTVDSNLGSNTGSLSNKFTIFPNPTFNLINFNTEENMKSIVLFDILGKEVLNKEVNSNSNSVDISNFNSGLYFVKIYFENGNINTQKIIKN
ncbi:T9SS type A sorting domain-containing protein [Flavobacterium sp. SUN052]|uniref:T9SS type A sorting domain-containing protein n=1 Tax=Flavobacterium sp. SUN052 TaxID=3002441 RepID=UPI00237E7499|nr:T9SS type A sorting domain-containing protein [Flavobacterium sp. SUN052]MEC4004733.1 T9SS type A sorting domain-containing protein [Flavobacterium sp. SUN052]